MEPSLDTHFIAFLENNGTSMNHTKMIDLIYQYSKLDFNVSCESFTTKQTIDSVFECFYGQPLSELIDVFNKQEKQTKHTSNMLALQQEILELKETIEELRQSYWLLKHNE